jgi:hypothetical protein
MNLKNNYFVVTVALTLFLVFSFVSARPIAPETIQKDMAAMRQSQDVKQPELSNQELEQQRIQQMRLTEKDTPWVRNLDPLFRHGGPDAGGYYYIDSDDDAQNRPVYNWIDISGTGTPVSFSHGTLDDGYSDPIDMGMNFNFYGNVYTSVAVTTNGIMKFGALAGSYLSNATIPAVALPNDMVAVEWDDLDARSGGTCYYFYDGGENKFIISWTDWSYYPAATTPNTPHNFQVILNGNDNSIICQYGDINGAWQADVSMGIENSAGTIGTLYAFNNAVTATGLAIYYGPDGPIFGTHNVAPQAFLAPGMYGQVGQAVTPQVRFRNIGSATESFPVRLIIYEGATERYNQTSNISNLPSNGTADITFPAFTPASEAIFTMTAITELGTDENRTNDTLRYAFQAFAQIVYLDFESAGVFDPTGDWEWGTPTSGPGSAHSGSNLWATTLAGNYPPNDNATLTSEEYTLGISSVLKFWHWYDTEARYDGGNVKITTDNGTTWELLHPEAGYSGLSNASNPLYPDSIFTGHAAGIFWQEAAFDLSAYNSQTVRIRFDFGTDGIIFYPGWYMDDFTLLGAGTFAHNVGPTRFLAPGQNGQVGTPITPQVDFRNSGDNTETFTVRLQIYQGANLLDNQTSTITNLPSRTNITVTFPAYTPASEAIYTLVAITELGTDMSPANDTLRFTFHAYQQIIFEDFESDGVFNPTGDWEWGVPTSGPNAAHSGVNVWGTTLAGTYPNSDYATLTTLEYSLGISSTLKFWHWYDTENRFDGGNVKITTDDGTTWELLHPNGGYDAAPYTANPLYPDSVFSGHIGLQWSEETFDLSLYNNQTVKIRFDFGSDASVVYPGWYIDDFTLLGAGTFAHNVGPTRFLAPGLYGQAGDPITPIVVFRNTGENTETFPVRLQIYQGANLLYNQTSTVTSLPVRGNDTITFPNYTPATEGMYTLVAITELVGDLSIANDTLRTNFRVYTNMAFYDFEADGVFTPDGDWEWGTPISGPGTAHSGVACWGTSLSTGTYPASDYATLTSTPFGIGPNALLSFWHWYDTENRYDGGNVKISSDGGTTWELLYPLDGYDDASNAANPLYPDSIFTDESGDWIQSTFDLSLYAGVSVHLRLDFGSDASVQSSGWYMDDLAVLGGAGVEPGWITGTVTNLSGGAPINGAFVGIGRIADTTGADGIYWLRTYPGTYPVIASAAFHNSSTTNVTVIENDTVTQNFALTAPVIQVDNTAIYDTLNLGQTRDHVRSISNTGNGQLDFSVSISYSRRLRPGNIIRSHTSGFDRLLRDSDITEAAPSIGHADPPVRDDFGDEVFTFDPQTPTGDEACLGIEFDGTHFWVTGRHPVDNVHKLHKFDSQGNLIESYDQGTSSTWGWRDLAWDGEYLYGSDESGLYQIDTSGSSVGTVPAPGGFTLPCRALAYDAALDHFWTANFSSNIVEFDRQGNTINSYPNTLSIYGMAWDDASVDGPWLWVFSQDGAPATLVSQFDPRIGAFTGVTFFAIDHNGGDDDLAGGLCFTTQWNPAFGILFCLVQGDAGGVSFDLVQGYEITPYSTWLVVTPRSGSVNAGGNTPLTITVDLSGLNIVNDTTFVATVIITNNSSVTPQIPVTCLARVGIDDITILPNTYALFQNYPNPFNSQTLVNFALPKESQVDLSVYNVLGQKVATLVSAKLDAGFHQAKWDASNVSTGIYYYKISAGDYTKIQQMTLLK